MIGQKIKQVDIPLGKNIRRIRLSKGIGQTALVRRLQLKGISMTRETLVKIERGTQHIQAIQLKAIKEVLETSYDELFAPEKEEQTEEELSPPKLPEGHRTGSSHI